MEGVYDTTSELQAGWERKKLGDVLTVIRGASPRPKGDPRYFGGDIPWIMISDITREKGKFLSQTRDHVTKEGATKSRFLPAGTLILSNSGTVCVPKILAVDGCIHDGFVAFPDLPSDFEILYLYYYFDFIRPRIINAHRQGITQVNLNTEIVKNIHLPIPPLDQQKRIVAEIEKQFSRLDQAVANLKRVKANLKRYKAAVLKAAVSGRLVETEAELAHREGRSYETGEQLLQRILETRRSQWQGKGKYKEPAAPDTTDLPELPELPEGWVWASVDQLVAHLTDGDHQAPPQTDQGIPFLVIGNVRSGEIDFSDTRFVGEAYYNSLDPKRQPKLGDLLYTLVGSYGIPVRVSTEKPFCIQRHMAILRPHEHSPMCYLTLAMASDNVFRQATDVATGTAQLTVPLAGLRQIAIPLPPLPEQRRIVAEVDRRLSLLRETEAQVDANLQRAERLRQSVLSAAFSGGLTQPANMAEAVAA